MNLMKAVSGGILILAFLFAALPVEAADIRITEMAVTTKIVKGNPIDSVHRISSSSVKALYCFTRLASDVEMNTSIKHVWYQDGVKVAEYDLPAKGLKWRTYSKKAVEKGLSGEWRVDALDSSGKLLKSVTFKMN